MATKVELGILDRTLNRIGMNLDDWHQSSWWCGTAGCFAAHLLFEAGYTIHELDELAVKPWQRRVWNFSEVRVSPIAIEAQAVGGLTDIEAATLFDGDNTYDMLEWIVSDIKGGYLQPWNHYADKADLGEEDVHG